MKISLLVLVFIMIMNLTLLFWCKENALVCLMVLECSMLIGVGSYCVSGANPGFCFFLFCLSSTETSIMLALFVNLVRYRGSVRIEGSSVGRMKGFK